MAMRQHAGFNLRIEMLSHAQTQHSWNKLDITYLQIEESEASGETPQGGWREVAG